MENIMGLNCENMWLLVWCGCVIWFLVEVFRKPNSYKTAKKLFPYIRVTKSFTYSNSISAKDPFKTQPINKIMIMDIAKNLDNEYYVKYLLDGEEKTTEVDDFVDKYGEYYNL